MTYDTFKKVVLERLGKDIPNPKNILIQPVQKNNGCMLDGLVILENDCNIAPTLYLNYYYELYENGANFQQIYQKILTTYLSNKPSESIDPSFFTDFENLRSKIMYKLVNYEKNRSLLMDVPHVRFLDLAIVYYCLISVSEDIGFATILIHKSHLDYWHITEDELFEIARDNTCRFLQPKLLDMDSLLTEIARRQNEPMPDLSEPTPYPMIVLTNQSNLFGAACILYESLIHSLAVKLQADLYLLPCSVHEMILIPATDDKSLADFSRMVRDVNQSQLNPEEILADHAYFYSRSEKLIKM